MATPEPWPISDGSPPSLPISTMRTTLRAVAAMSDGSAPSRVGAPMATTMPNVAIRTSMRTIRAMSGCLPA